MTRSWSVWCIGVLVGSGVMLGGAACELPPPDDVAPDASPGSPDAAADAAAIDAGIDATLPPDATTHVTLFEEDFDDLVPGTNLVGNFGWTGAATVRVGDTVFGSRGVAGRTQTGSNAMGYAIHEIPFEPGYHYEIKVRAYAVVDALMSDNAGVYAYASGIGPGATGSGWLFQAGNWKLDLNFVSGGSVFVDGLAGVVAELELHLDAVNGFVWGAYTVDGVRGETEHYKMDLDQFARLDGVLILEDYRNVVGADFDDLVVIRSEP